MHCLKSCCKIFRNLKGLNGHIVNILIFYQNLINILCLYRLTVPQCDTGTLSPVTSWDLQTMTMGDSNKNLYAKMIVDVVLGPVLERVGFIAEEKHCQCYTKIIYMYFKSIHQDCLVFMGFFFGVWMHW